MGKRLGLILCSWTLVAAAAVGVAAAAGGGEAPVNLIPENELSVVADFVPKALAKQGQTPIRLKISGDTVPEDGTHPPALRELTIEFDKAIEIHTEGIPACKLRELPETADTAVARKRCRSALVGEGRATVQVAHPEGGLDDLDSKLLVFKGSERNGRTTLLVDGYFSAPISAAMVTQVTIAKHLDGRFGTRAIATIPQVAEGYGSLTKFDLEIFKEVKVGGERYNPVSASCSDGKLKALSFGTFEDDSMLQSESVRACTSRP